MQMFFELIKKNIFTPFALLIFIVLYSQSAYAIDWQMSQKLSNGDWDNQDDARKIQSRLIDVGCLKSNLQNYGHIIIDNKQKNITSIKTSSKKLNQAVKPIGTNNKTHGNPDGLWGNTSVAAFNGFLSKSGKSYSAGMSTLEVLALFDGITKRNLGDCTSVINSSITDLKCDLPRLVNSWLDKQDKIAKGKISEKDKKQKYTPFLTLKRALETADSTLDKNAVIRNVDNVIPDKSSMDLEQWLLPKSVDLDMKRDELKSQISNLLFNISAIARYYAIQDEVRYKFDQSSKTSSCQRCILLTEYRKLEKAAKIFSDNKTLVVRSTNKSISMNEITFSMLENQLMEIRDWNVSFKEWIRENKTEDGDRARGQLDGIIGNMISHKIKSERKEHDKELAISWVANFDRDCGDFSALGQDGGMPALVWN